MAEQEEWEAEEAQVAAEKAWREEEEREHKHLAEAMVWAVEEAKAQEEED